MKLENGVTIEKVEVLPTPMPYPPGHINSYLVRAEEPILIDTGVRSDAAWKALGEGLGRHGLSIEKIRHLLITHAHVDHYGQAKKIKDASGCQVYSNVRERPHLEHVYGGRSQAAESPNLEYFREWGVSDQMIKQMALGREIGEGLLEPVGVDRTVSDGECFEISGVEFRAVWVPGHAIGHTVFLVDDWRVMFSADHLLPDISPVPLLNFPDPTKKGKILSLMDYRASLTKVEHENLAVAFPSHGAPILDHRDLIKGYRLHHDRRRLRVERYLRAHGPMTAFELSCCMFGESRAQMLLYLTMSEAVGYLEWLGEEGRLLVDNREGVHYYSLDPNADTGG